MKNPLLFLVPPTSPPQRPCALSPAPRALCPLLLLPLALLLLSPSSAHPQEALTEHTYERSPGSPGPAVSIDVMAWLAGSWEGEALGGIVEETWSPPRAGAMMGMFRLVQDDKTVFYELMTILEEDGSLVLRLKHFNGGDLSAWEEKKETVDFPLVEVADGAFRFGGMSFHPRGDDRVTVYLAMHQKDGPPKEIAFDYTRAGTTTAGAEE